MIGIFKFIALCRLCFDIISNSHFQKNLSINQNQNSINAIIGKEGKEKEKNFLKGNEKKKTHTLPKHILKEKKGTINLN